MKIRLLKLHCENFKCFKDKTVVLGGRTSFFGRNASGKTTLMDLFFWVLFNKMADGSQPDKIRPHKSDGQDIDFVDIIGELDLEIDGRPVHIKKVQRQKWTTPRGKAEKRFDGNFNEYEINDIPKTENDFKGFIESSVSEEIFRFASNAAEFLKLKTKDRRAKLFELVAGFTNEDVIQNSPVKFESLAAELQTFTLEELQAKNSKVLRERRKHMEELPSRIDEASRALVDVAEFELASAELKREIAEIDRRENDAMVAIKQVDDATNNIIELKTRQSEMVRAANEVLVAQRREIQERIDTVEDGFFKALGQQSLAEMGIEHAKKAIEQHSATKRQLGEKYMEARKSVFEESKWVFDKDSIICPNCGQEYPIDRMEQIRGNFDSKKAQAIEKFTSEKKKHLCEIEAAGSNEKIAIDENASKIIDYEKQIEQAKADKVTFNAARTVAYEEMQSLPDKADMSDNQDYEALCLEIVKKEEALTSMNTGGDYRQQLKAQRDKLQLELSSYQAQITGNTVADQRVENLKEERTTLAQKIADEEKKQFLLEEFNRAKISMLTDCINKNFAVVKWKLFEQQVNGGYKEICEPTIGGTSYGNGLNAGHRILAEMDIVNTLQKIYRVSVPVFLDNAERLSSDSFRSIVAEMDCQLVTLAVSEDSELKIEVAQ